MLLVCFFSPLSCDVVVQPAVGSTKPNSVKTRPTSLSTGDAAAPLKRSAPTSSSANKKSPVTKATTPTAGTKRPTAANSQTPTATKFKVSPLPLPLPSLLSVLTGLPSCGWHLVPLPFVWLCYITVQCPPSDSHSQFVDHFNLCPVSSPFSPTS